VDGKSILVPHDDLIKHRPSIQGLVEHTLEERSYTVSNVPQAIGRYIEDRFPWHPNPQGFTESVYAIIQEQGHDQTRQDQLERIIRGIIARSFPEILK
jgi:hypothetical protein